MGYIIEHLLKKQLTVVEQFHSHLEPMKFLNKDTFDEQVCFLILFWNYWNNCSVLKGTLLSKIMKFYPIPQFQNSNLSTIPCAIPQFLFNSSIPTIQWSQISNISKNISYKNEQIPNFSISVIQFHHADD